MVMKGGCVKGGGLGGIHGGPDFPDVIIPKGQSNFPMGLHGVVKELPLRIFGELHIVEGGPWTMKPIGKKPVRGICMAAEKDIAPGDLKVAVKDFGTPDPDQIIFALKVALAWLLRGEKVYVGCGAGQGRTGLFLAALAKVALESNPYPANIDPIAYVRVLYNQKAVETQKQEQFIDDLDVSGLVKEMAEFSRLIRAI